MKVMQASTSEVPHVGHQKSDIDAGANPSPSLKWAAQ